MRTTLLPFLLIASLPALAQTSPAPFKGANTIVLHTADSAKVAYAKVTQALLAAGYGIDKAEAGAFFVRTPAKPLPGSLNLTIQAFAVPSASGSDVTFSGQFTLVNAATIMARVDKREMPAQCMGRGSTPVQRAWEELQRVASLAAPQARPEYTAKP